MDSINKNWRSPNLTRPTPQTPPRKVASQTEVPTTPPNLRTLSPPGAPRARQFRRHEDMFTQDDQRSTPSRTRTRYINRFSGSGARRETGSPINTRSRSPPRDRRHLNRSRSPLGSHDRVRRTPEVALGPSLVMPSTQSPLGVNHTNQRFPFVFFQHRNQRLPLANGQSPSQSDIDTRYFNMLSLEDPEHDRSITESTSSGLQKDDDAKTKSPEEDLDAFYKTGKPFWYDIRETK